MSLFLFVYPVSSPSAYSLSLYLLPHSSFKAVTSVLRPYLLSHLLALCPLSISPSVSSYLFFTLTVRSSPLHLLFFTPHLLLPSGFYIDFLPLTCLSLTLSLSGPSFALINFGAYEMMLFSSSSNFLTLSLFPPVCVSPAGGRGGSMLDRKKSEEEG